MLSKLVCSALLLGASLSSASPVSARASSTGLNNAYDAYFDLQGHRGTMGQVVENILPGFAQALIAGVRTIELDLLMTADDEIVVWHDEQIFDTKCRDSAPVVPDDPLFPYVGKHIANLTLAQVKTLDCGSLRINNFPNAEVVPGTKISTLREFFDFMHCATDEAVHLNIEPKFDPVRRNRTRSPEDFDRAFGEVVVGKSAEMKSRIYYQSFDWRAIILSKQSRPEIKTGALVSDGNIWAEFAPGQRANLTHPGTAPGPWFAGISIDDFEGETVAERVVRAAHFIKADYVAASVTAGASTAADPALPGWIPFANQTMVDVAHSLGMEVKSWTANRKNLLEYLLSIDIDGVITDYPYEFRRTLEAHHPELALAPLGDEGRVKRCLKEHNQLTGTGLPSKGYFAA